MTHANRHPRFRSNRPALVAVVVGLWLASGITPATLAAPGVAARAGETKHRCPCGMDCGAVCCCKPKKPAAPARPKTPTRTPAPAGPCMATAPCGGVLPPGVPAVALAVEKADRAGVVVFYLWSVVIRLAPPISDRPATGPISPPDEPPEPPFDV